MCNFAYFVNAKISNYSHCSEKLDFQNCQKLVFSFGLLYSYGNDIDVLFGRRYRIFMEDSHKKEKLA